MFKFSYDNGRVTKSLVRWVREATLINIPLYRLGVGLLTFFWEGLGWSKMLTGSPFIDKNHLRFSLLLMFVNEVCAFAFLGIFSLSFNAEIVFLVPIHLERQRRSFDFDSYKTYKQKMSKYLMVRFVCLWAMIPWITLVVMALGHTSRRIVFSLAWINHKSLIQMWEWGTPGLHFNRACRFQPTTEW